MRNSIILVLLLALAPLSSAVAQNRVSPKRSTTARTAKAAPQPNLSQLAGDAQKLKTAVSEKFVGILPDGTLTTKAELLAKLADGRIKLGKVEELETVTAGGTRLNRGLLKFNEQKMVRFSETWSLVAAKWVLVGWQASPASPAQYLAKKLAEGKKVITTDSGLQYFDIVEGTGESPKQGGQVTVHYTGTLENGQKFDSSVDRGQPFEFTIGVGRVIKGWDEGVMSMKIGGRRKLIIPSQLAYGSRGVGPIPPDSTLIFEVELLGVK